MQLKASSPVPRTAALCGLARRLHVASAADERGILADRRRLADQVALHGVAALLREEGELLLGLDALGDDRHFEAVPEIDDGAHDRGRLRVAGEVDDEGAGGLDL